MRVFLNRKCLGFSLVEISFSLAAIGIVIGMGLPIAKVSVDHVKHTADKQHMMEIRDLLVGYAMMRGGFPEPDAGDVLPSTNLGTTVTNAYTTDVQYYVNALLTDVATVQDFTTLCDTAKDILDGTTVSTEPAICNSVSDAFVNCTDSTVMAFVVVSPGRNRAMEHENSDGDQDYENPTKKPNELNDYDDVIASYGLPALVSECQSF